MSTLRVFTFAPDWGLPTTGPFALKLLAWMKLNGVAYEQVIEDNSSKGPRGKSPWIEHEGKCIGDSDAIIRYLAGYYGKPVEPETSDPRARAAAHALKVAFEEEFHQILEWELFFHPEGAAYIDGQIRKGTPPLVGRLVSRMVSRHFHRQLHARGIARHDANTIATKGRADLDALSAYLDGRPFLTGVTPILADLAVFGQVAPVLHWPMNTPLARHARALAPVRNWCERIVSLAFAEQQRPSPPGGSRHQAASLT